ncbi:MAG TPA: bifunctional ADP-dependent NAD(P)H-hydrate dehydratase/NAD(P)H-hydrate epimerase [Solibacterales bacterium]|nr:bifunctional ADP-dependent NAD(P)H-hydrate dehydratase/NAD(P)H-hydrate epimerase [Bryobacterales bacterium]
MKVLTADQMRAVDRRTIERGIPGAILMENAGCRVVEFLSETFAPLKDKHVVVLCGKGNNGGDGLVVARQLWTRLRPKRLDVVLGAGPEELQGDAAMNWKALAACGCPAGFEVTPEMYGADLLLDAILGTGLRGPAAGAALDLINHAARFRRAQVVAVDLPSGLPSDTGAWMGNSVRADYTVTFTAPKISQVLPPNCDAVGRLIVAPIGSPPDLFEADPGIWLELAEPQWFAPLFAKRAPGGHKGDYGHVIVAGGSPGKTGAAGMCALAALRMGAGLATVVSDAPAAHAPEVMTAPLAELDELVRTRDVTAIGPGLGTRAETVAWVRRLVCDAPRPMVVDADALNALSGFEWRAEGLRVLTPHPGEMARLTGTTTAEVQANRLEMARRFAMERGVTLVLKGQRTLIAFPEGGVIVNPTGTPAMGTGGTGDILTGMIAGLLAQWPEAPALAVAAAVWLHGRAGELGAGELGESPLIATDLLRYLPEAIREIPSLRDIE